MKAFVSKNSLLAHVYSRSALLGTMHDIYWKWKWSSWIQFMFRALGYEELLRYPYVSQYLHPGNGMLSYVYVFIQSRSIKEIHVCRPILSPTVCKWGLFTIEILGIIYVAYRAWWRCNNPHLGQINILVLRDSWLLFQYTWNFTTLTVLNPYPTFWHTSNSTSGIVLKMF